MEEIVREIADGRAATHSSKKAAKRLVDGLCSAQHVLENVEPMQTPYASLWKAVQTTVVTTASFRTHMHAREHKSVNQALEG